MSDTISITKDAEGCWPKDVKYRIAQALHEANEERMFPNMPDAQNSWDSLGTYFKGKQIAEIGWVLDAACVALGGPR